MKGRITVIDRASLEATCECSTKIRCIHQRLLPGTYPEPPKTMSPNLRKR
jgi:hypothetical protein